MRDKISNRYKFNETIGTVSNDSNGFSAIILIEYFITIFDKVNISIKIGENFEQFNNIQGGGWT